MQHTMKAALAALILSSTAGVARAESPWYVGGALGASHLEVDCRGFSQCDNNDTGVKLHLGHSLPLRGLPGFALEGGYVDFGKAKASTSIVARTTKASAVLFNAAIRPELSGGLRGVLRGGVAVVDASDTVTAGPVGANNGTDNSAHLYLGVGLDYSLSKQLSLTGALDYTSYDTGNQSGSLRLLSVGLQYGF